MTLHGYITLGAIDGCDCGGACGCDDARTAWGLAGLGVLGLTAGATGAIASSGQAGRIVQSGGGPIYVPGTADCAASGVSGGAQNLQLAGKVGGLALTAAATPWAGAGTALITGPVTFGISIAIAGIVGIFSTIFSHHAAAVKKEQNVLCTAVPAANNYLDVIDQAVASGAASAQKALQALDSLASDFRSAVSGIYKSCNAACVMQMCLDAALATQRAKYSALAAQQAAAPTSVPVTTITPSVAPGAAAAGPTAAPVVASGSTLTIPPAAAPSSTTSLPSWWPLAALVLFGFVVSEIV